MDTQRRSRPLFARLLGRLRRHLRFELCRVVGRALEHAARNDAPVHIRFALLSEAELAPRPGLGLDARAARRAFERGDLCVGAFDGERLVGYQWFAFRPAPHVDGVWVRFGAGARYSYRKFVDPAYRGQRIAQGLSSHADALCLARGLSSSVAFISLDNEASWHASRRLGSRTLGYAGYVQIAGRFLAFRSPGARRCGFSFYKPASGAPLSERALASVG